MLLEEECCCSRSQLLLSSSCFSWSFLSLVFLGSDSSSPCNWAKISISAKHGGEPEEEERREQSVFGGVSTWMEFYYLLFACVCDDVRVCVSVDVGRCFSATTCKGAKIHEGWLLLIEVASWNWNSKVYRCMWICRRRGRGAKNDGWVGRSRNAGG